MMRTRRGETRDRLELGLGILETPRSRRILGPGREWQCWRVSVGAFKRGGQCQAQLGKLGKLGTSIVVVETEDDPWVQVAGGRVRASEGSTAEKRMGEKKAAKQIRPTPQSGFPDPTPNQEADRETRLI
ncbi:hypothetical protein MAPG_03276 [Magnaporthiopsis poae ATCC 64411]|uniref:Uncharacterized protein n=1 Tax=Magnaporthiopsis poae (strain ATCC 64411 / 73-15) TaxID=644358 RepID=A0A0C4DTK6_MAGP6|nr:hypothetical protein MAPG_03276 [Magnaporthiopsis poae ATCC 64411]